MKRLFFIPALFLLFANVEAQDTNFTASANLVIIDATVRDKAGKVVPDLKKSDFTLFEDGKLQTISVFEFQKLEGDTSPPAAPAGKPAEQGPAVQAPAAPKKVTTGPTTA